MDHNFWIERWQKHEIGFHQDKVQPALVAHWPKLVVEPGATVFVPLCGKSLDMTWLAEQGLNVVGNELSSLAVKEFFEARGEVPDVRQQGGFEISSKNGIEIWCGDFFALDRATLPKFDAFYDRAALVAMPPAMQRAYVDKLAALTPTGAQGLLIGLDYNPEEMQGPPFSLPRTRVLSLLIDAFDVGLIDARDGLAKSDHLAKRGVTRLEEASYLLRRR